MKILLTTLGIVVVLILIGWGGLQVKPPPFSLQMEHGKPINYRSLPDSLPAPVQKFYNNLYGDSIPVVNSAIITGRGEMRINGITFPARYCFVHDAGEAYRHYFELTLWGFPILKVNEYYLDGKARLELPFGTVADEPKVDQGANLALWGEALWYPSVFVTDSRIQWKQSDQHQTTVSVPYGNRHQDIRIRFDTTNGLPDAIEAMRYKESDSEEKTLWTVRMRGWETVNRFKLFTGFSITWFDEGAPWATFEVDSVAYNKSVRELLHSRSLKTALQ